MICELMLKDKHKTTTKIRHILLRGLGEVRRMSVWVCCCILLIGDLLLYARLRTVKFLDRSDA